MYLEAKKLHLIGEILKIEDEKLLLEIESLIARNKKARLSKPSFNVFAGMLSDEEVDAFEKNINEVIH